MNFKEQSTLIKRFIGTFLLRHPKHTIFNLKRDPFGTLKSFYRFLFKESERTQKKLRFLHHYSEIKDYHERTFKHIKNFVIFICHGRSGHSLVGSLLDAHPNIIISHELNVFYYLKYLNFDYLNIYRMLLNNSSLKAGSESRFQTGYDYNVPYEFAGKYSVLKVIGDKKGRGTIKFIKRNPDFIPKLLQIFGKKLKIITIFRNPYDNIAAIAYRRKERINKTINEYFDNIDTFIKFRKKIPEDQIIIFRNEELIDDPQKILKQICSFLKLDAPNDYLEACSGIVYKSPHERRHKQEWSQEQLQKIDSLMKKDKYSEFMAGYEF